MGYGTKELASGPLDIDDIDINKDQNPLPNLQKKNTINNNPPYENDSDCANVFSLLKIYKQIQ